MIFRFVLNSAEYGAYSLQEEPGGWKDIEIMLARSLEYHDVMYEVMAPLDFTCRAGKEYIDKAIEEIGVDAVINISIYISCSTGSGGVESPDYSIDYSDDYGSMLSGSGAPLFELIFEGVLDLKNYNQTSEETSVSIIQSDFVQTIFNRLETQIEVTKNESLDGVALTAIADFPSYIGLHSKAILLQTRFTALDYQEDLITYPINDTVYANMPFFVDIDELGGAIDATVPYLRHFKSTSTKDSYLLKPFYQNITDQDIALAINYVVKATFKFSIPLDDTIGMQLLFNHNNFGDVSEPSYGTISIIQDYPADSYVGGTLYTKTIDVSGTEFATINPGRSEYFYITFPNLDTPSVAGDFHFEIEIEEFSIEYEYSSVKDLTGAGIFKIHELGAAIAQRITSQEDCFRSTLLGRKNSLPTAYDENGCGSFLGSLNGKHIRGFTAPSTPYFSSMRDYFKTINALLNCGLGIDKIGDQYVMVLEKKSFFYNTDVILQCPNASGIKVRVAKEYYVSDIYAGYEKWETENVNGLDEFNTKRQYNTGVKAIESRLNIESPMIASMYSIEFARRQGVSTTDYRYDKDNFIIALARGVDGDGNPNQLDQAEKDENFDTVTGFLSPETAYNIRLAPARNTLNHFNSIAGSIEKFPDRAVKFVYGEGNFDVVTEFTNETCDNSFLNEPLSESQDITVEETGLNPIWIPEYIEYDYPLTFSDYLLIKANRRKCIEVSDNETTFMKGYIIDLRYRPVGGIASFKLLKA